jgi:ubiquinone/menaquinone biosynthesis C-methylase UbiE
MVHEVAAEGFGNPADYEAARPGYPIEAIAWFTDALGLAPGRRVCELAAGTGKFTRLLTTVVPKIWAVEPVAGMRATFRTVFPSLPLLAATAEAMPFADASLDVVLAAQAWHWFDFDRAAAEMARIVRTGGGVGMVWNARDRSIEWVDEIWTIMDRVEKRAPWRDHENWRESARRLPRFGEMDAAEFSHRQSLTPAQVEQRVASVSHVAVLPPDERAAVLAEVRAVLDGHDETRGRATVELPYRVDCIAYRRSP